MSVRTDIRDTLLPDSVRQAVQIGSDSLGARLPDSVATDTVQEPVRTVISHPGLEGTPLPYRLQSDPGIAVALLFCFLLTAYILSRGKKFLIQQLKDFSITRERSSIFSATTVSDFRYRLFLLFQTCVLFGICFFDYFQSGNPVLVEQWPPYVVLFVYIVVCTVYLFCKWIVYRFLGWVFFDKIKTNSWLEAYSVILYYLGFVLYPVVLLTVYTDVADGIWVPLVLGLVIFAKILMFYKWLKVFFSKLYGILYLIVYFCALELIPTLMIYRVLVHINNLLLIK